MHEKNGVSNFFLTKFPLRHGAQCEIVFIMTRCSLGHRAQSMELTAAGRSQRHGAHKAQSSLQQILLKNFLVQGSIHFTFNILNSAGSMRRETAQYRDASTSELHF